MGLLDKTNPRATPESVRLHAVIGGVLGFVACVAYFLIWGPEYAGWPLLTPIAALLGAALLALIEWQVDDVLDASEIIREVEVAFGMTLSDSDCENIFVVGDLHRAVLAAVRRQDEAADEEEVWRRLHAILVRELGIEPERITRSTDFHSDLGVG
ncbi:acyl carrier protein [Pseudobythopirellula maris]|uniref:Acyl carrier protein n=1 Tax=Pseudobythopirellula maris TaxID=2527991 RepID=A0A5C5ZUE0_9BACT|nr:BTAD domain-containing putative transcriptional regulator [Pseudobythopirellula maris]TWT90860.1 acyl carrier protein [Pseudobythopirellula maris]